VGLPYRLKTEGQRPISGREEKAIFHSDSNTRYGNAAMSNATMNARIRFGNSAKVGDGCRQQLCI